MNNVQLIGRLGRDPETRQTTGGTAVVNASLAVSKRIKGQDQVTWVRLVFWDKAATIVSQYCKKGSQIAVVGELQTREYVHDGQNKSITEVRVHNLDLLGRGPGAEKQREPGEDDDIGGFEDDAIPF
jgi:single-strand DNA-binding protein